MVGIYKITNKLNNKIYIGQSIDIKRRWAEHRARKGSSPLYDDMNEFGLENFIFEVIEECKENELNKKEIYWIKHYDSFNKGYNQTTGGQGISFIVKQKQYLIKKDIKENDPIIMLKWEDYTNAAKNLSPAALNLYMYLAKNQDGYNFYFSSKDYCNTFNVVDRTFRNAKKELLTKGYLKEGESNSVYFSAAGTFYTTISDLQQKLKEIGKRLDLVDEEKGIELYNKIKEANLKTIEDENIYKITIGKLISFGEDMLKEYTEQKFNKIL